MTPYPLLTPQFLANLCWPLQQPKQDGFYLLLERHEACIRAMIPIQPFRVELKQGDTPEAPRYYLLDGSKRVAYEDMLVIGRDLTRGKQPVTVEAWKDEVGNATRAA